MWGGHSCPPPLTLLSPLTLIFPSTLLSPSCSDWSISLEHPRFAHQKIRQRAQRDRNRIGEQIVHVALPDHHSHECEITENGDGSVGQIEAQQPRQRMGPGGLHSVSPGELFVPDEIV